MMNRHDTPALKSQSFYSDGPWNATLLRGKLSRLVLGVVLVLSGSACTTVSYYAQAVNGHFKLMAGREPIDELIASEDTDETLKAKLQLLIDARKYASETLHLPSNDSYSSYVDTGRDYVTWNVVAAPEFSLVPKTWCFPVAGCVSYRGYFKEASAQAFSDELKEQGFDVIVGGALAYSTLGWFDDPLVNTMMRGSNLRLIGTLFHELAHQKLYVKDDSNFNEAYASFVEQQGVRQWLADHEKDSSIPGYDAYLQRQVDFNELLQATRKKLVALYREEKPEGDLRLAKQDVFEQMRADYLLLKESWNGYKGYDNWFNRELNNARLVAVSTYRMWVPAFSAIFEETGGFTAFYERAAEIGAMTKPERTEILRGYLP